MIKIELKVEPGKTLLDALREQQIYIDAPCGGHGSCGRCRVRFCGDIPEPTEKDRRLLSAAELTAGIRLACAVQPRGSCTVEVLSQGEEEMAVLIDGRTPSVQRTENAAGRRAVYGAAIDIGTTTLAASLLEITKGRRIATASAVNHQRAYGADVISRIQAACGGQAEALQRSICADIGELLRQLTKQAGLPTEAVSEIVVAGNTTMCHLLRGLSCAGLGAAPFVPEDISLWEGSAKEFPMLADWNARMTILPGISAFVGADIVAGIYGNDLDLEESNLFLDIGTNGEMAIGGREGFLVTSAAAGPVFEGGNIGCGVPGVPGAIAGISLALVSGDGTAGISGMDDAGNRQRDAAADEEEGQALRLVTTGCRVIRGAAAGHLDDGVPVGLCGTGIIDMMGELVRLGLVDENGTLDEPWFTAGISFADGKLQFTQADIRQIQMGKAAIRAGMETLLEKYGKSEFGKVCVAGGFGSDLNVEQAIRIGMFAKAFAGRVELLGNSALAGAERFLLEDRGEAAARMGRIIRQTTEIGLATDEGFYERYLSYMNF